VSLKLKLNDDDDDDDDEQSFCCCIMSNSMSAVAQFHPTVVTTKQKC